jgi:two-component system chemotaxis response regulator CheB
MFASLARVCPKKSLGIVLSGMGRDGAEGLLKLRQAGGICLAQDESSSAIHGMPRAAIDLGAIDHVMDVGAMFEYLMQPAEAGA